VGWWRHWREIQRSRLLGWADDDTPRVTRLERSRWPLTCVWHSGRGFNVNATHSCPTRSSPVTMEANGGSWCTRRCLTDCLAKHGGGHLADARSTSVMYRSTATTTKRRRRRRRKRRRRPAFPDMGTATHELPLDFAYAPTPADNPVSSSGRRVPHASATNGAQSGAAASAWQTQ
jgi:hypothetical protein